MTNEEIRVKLKEAVEGFIETYEPSSQDWEIDESTTAEVDLGEGILAEARIKIEGHWKYWRGDLYEPDEYEPYYSWEVVSVVFCDTEYNELNIEIDFSDINGTIEP